MNKSMIFSISMVIIFSALITITNSQMEIVINGNVVIEQINNNENGGIQTTTMPLMTTTVSRNPPPHRNLD